MALMFSSAVAFNADISAWNTANVTSMAQMFYGAGAFNRDISGWNTAKVTTMALMFFANNVFNQNIGAWNVEKVTTFAGMFSFAGGMKQSLAAWSPLLATDLTLWNLHDINSPNSATNQDNYNNTLISWAGKALQPNVPLSMGVSKYTIATAGVARAALVTNGWTINDGGGV
jgi:surface protein